MVYIEYAKKFVHNFQSKRTYFEYEKSTIKDFSSHWNVPQIKLQIHRCPIITRWGTWLNTAMYYCEHFKIIKKFINLLNSDDAIVIKKVKKNCVRIKFRIEFTFYYHQLWIFSQRNYLFKNSVNSLYWFNQNYWECRKLYEKN